ncbi:MAG: methyltransferase domain-containing protein [Gammaproteobacteria bacterium]
MSLTWLESGIGPALLREESLQVAGAFENIFGDQLLQIGEWGDSGLFRRFARTRRYAVVSATRGPGVDFVSELENLAVANDSIDAVFLPHTLETAKHPHSVLREFYRILRPDGHVVVAGFNAWGLWGVRHQLSRGKFPAGVRRMVSEYRVRDWLQLLEFSAQSARFHFVSPPLYGTRRPIAPLAEEAAETDAKRLATNAPACRWHPLAACYLLVARRDVFSVTPIRPAIRRQTRLVGGLVNPTTRNAA